MTYSGHFISGPPCISITDLASAFHSNNQPEGQPLSEASLVSWQKAERKDAELEDPVLKWHVPHHCHSHFISQNKSWSPSWFVLPSVGRLLITNLMSLLRMRWTIMQDSLGKSRVQADSRCWHVGLGDCLLSCQKSPHLLYAESHTNASHTYEALCEKRKKPETQRG